MSIQALPSDVCAIIFGYLEVADRISCRSLCKLFKNVLDDSRYELILWPKPIIKQLKLKETKFPFIQRVLQRQLLGKDGVVVKPIGFAEKLTQEVQQLLSYGNLLIGTTRDGEAKIWHMGQGTNSCSYSIPPDSEDDLFGDDVRFSLEGNWLIRGAMTTDEARDHFLLRVDVWELDQKSGAAKEIFTRNIPYTFRPEHPKLVAPKRYDDTLYIPIPCSSQVQVWSLEEQLESMDNVIPVFHENSYISHLQIIDDSLLIGDSSGRVKGLSLSTRVPFSQRYGGGCVLFDRFLVNAGDGTIFLENLLSDQNSCWLADSTKKLTLGRLLEFDHDWLAVSAGDQDVYLGVCLFSLQNERDDHGTIADHAFIPHPVGFDPESDNVLMRIGWHHFVQAYKNSCFVYSLWNLKRDATGTVIPNQTYVLPETSEITTLSFHEGMVVAGTADGTVWKFTY